MEGSNICWGLQLGDHIDGNLVIADLTIRGGKITGTTRNSEGLCDIEGECKGDNVKINVLCRDNNEENFRLDLTLNREKQQLEGFWNYISDKDFGKNVGNAILKLEEDNPAEFKAFVANMAVVVASVKDYQYMETRPDEEIMVDDE